VLPAIFLKVVQKQIFGEVSFDHPNEDIKEVKDFCSLRLSLGEM